MRAGGAPCRRRRVPARARLVGGVAERGRRRSGDRAQVPLVGVSLVLDHPRPTGRQAGWPWRYRPSSPGSPLSAPARSQLAPRALRCALLRSVDRGSKRWRSRWSPTVAQRRRSSRHLRARGAARRSARRARRPDPVGRLHRPREPVGPLGAAAIALGLAGRLWRDGVSLAPDGTIVGCTGFRPRFTRAGTPFRALYEAHSTDLEHLAEAERLAAAITRDRRLPRRSRVHPPPSVCGLGAVRARARAGRPGDRRRLPRRRRCTTAGLRSQPQPPAALEMALGVAGEDARVGVLLAPPYPPLVVG